MCAPSAPATPDYTGAAQAQGQANLEAARLQTQLNRYDQVTPWGSLKWTNDASLQPSGVTTANGNTGFTGTGAESPMNVRSASGSPLIDRVGATMGIATNGAATGTGLPASTDPNRPAGSPGDHWTSTVTLSPEQQALFDSQNRISQSLANTSEAGLNRVSDAMGQGFSTAGMPELSGGPSNGQIQSRIGNTRIQGSINTPTYQTGLDTSGVSALPNSDSFSGDAQRVSDAIMARQNQNFGQQQQSLEQQLANQGIAPGSEAYNRARQPLDQARVDAQNQALLAGYQQQNNLFNQQLATNAQGFGQAQARGQFANDAASQQLAAALGAGNFTNSAAAQRFSQNLAGGQFGNQAQAQAYQQALSSNQQNNAARQQAIQEQAYLRQLPLNELNALRTGAQVQSPTFSSAQNAGSVQPAPIFAGAQAAGNAAQQAYGQQLGGYNNMLSGLFGLGSSALPFFL